MKKLIFLLLWAFPVSGQFLGPLKASTTNPRYFTDNSGKAILLTGSHTWATMFDQGESDPPPVFNITQFCDYLKNNGHNFTRTFVWEQSRRGTWIAGAYFWFNPPAYFWFSPSASYWFNPPPMYKRTGPGTAEDGKLKWNLDSLYQPYFDWIRTRVDTFYHRGIYVSIQLFNGFSVTTKGMVSNPWLDHPMNSTNNVNDIDGHNATAGSYGGATQSLLIPAIWRYQSKYIKRLVDALNDYDNVLWEVSNESYSGSQDWQYQIIDTLRAYEATKPKQHPIGMTVEWPGGDNNELFASHADWISPNRTDAGGYDYGTNPRPSTGTKVILIDTDHLWGNAEGKVVPADFIWMSFTRGYNVLWMDGYDGKAYGTGHPWTSADSASASSADFRKNMGYILSYANKMDLVNMIPSETIASTGFCLAKAVSTEAQYLVYFPSGGAQTVDLTAATGVVNVEWFDPKTGVTTSGGTTTGGTSRSFVPPFNGNAVLFLCAGPATVHQPPVLAAPTIAARAIATNPTRNTSTGASSCWIYVIAAGLGLPAISIAYFLYFRPRNRHPKA